LNRALRAVRKGAVRDKKGANQPSPPIVVADGLYSQPIQPW